jgi:hypothetical protein
MLAVVGAGLTVLLAFLGSVDEPPSASTQALIGFLAIMAQLGAAWVFSGEGKVDPTLAQRSVARLVRLARRAEGARREAELLAVKGIPAGHLREGVGHLSVHLSYLEEGYVDAIEDWRMFHPHAVDAAEEAIERKSVDDE